MARFVHTADLHLDSPLRSLALRDPELAGLIGGATRTALGRIVDLCIAERVDALLIAGDLYDREMRSMKTAAFLAAEMRRLDAAGVRVVMIRGNHDAASQITARLDLPGNVDVLDAHGGTVEIAEAGLAVHGMSLPNRPVPESLLPRYPAPVPGLVNVGLMHTSLGGAAGHDDYAPCSVAELAAHGYDYWALGHVHARTVHAERPWIVMPGMPQGRDIGEAGPKSATLATLEGGRLALSEHPTAVAEFARIDLAPEPGDDRAAIFERLRDAVRSAGEAAAAEHAVIRIAIRGRHPLWWRLRRDADQLRADAREAAAATGRVWIEGLSVETAEPDARAPEPGADPVHDLTALMREAAAEPGFAAEVERLAKPLLDALPAELRDRYGADPETRAARLSDLAGEGIAEVAARFHVVEDTAED